MEKLVQVCLLALVAIMIAWFLLRLGGRSLRDGEIPTATKIYNRERDPFMFWMAVSSAFFLGVAMPSFVVYMILGILRN